MIIKRNLLIIGTIVWWLIFVVLSITGFNRFQILNIIGFLFLALVPGMLTVLILKLGKLPSWANLSMSVAFSLLELMVVGLTGNFLLPRFGIVQPLAQHALIGEINILLLVLAVIAWVRLRDWEFAMHDKLREIFPSKFDTWLSLLPMLFVAQSIIGAFSLNNGGSGLWTLAMLGEIAIYSSVLYFSSRKIGENTMPVGLFFMSLALLLMTSLRGWYITGHDIQVEYKVFELTKNAGIWSIAFYRDAYNACLSITILPTIFFNLLKVSDPYIYKLFFQCFFALCPGIAYLISRHWADKRLSFLTGFYFLAFPTFFVDMPFLVRQEVAFIFYGLMIYLIFEQKLDLKIRQWLFMFMGIGVILSHYSTTYTILLIFMLAVVSRPIFLRLFGFLQANGSLGTNSALQISSHAEPPRRKANITLTMVIALALLSFLWTSIITNTGGQLNKVLRETLSAVANGFTENSRSTDAVNLLSFRTPSQQQEFEDYITKIIDPIRKAASPGVYYDESVYSKYNFAALPDQPLPLTRLGIFVQKSGVDFVSWITLLGRALAKFMEILTPLGVLYILFRKSFLKYQYIDSEFYLLSVYALFSILLLIVIPILSTEYGIYRAMQQSMFILALPMAIGSVWIGSWIQKIKLLPSRFYLKIRGIPIQSFSDVRSGAFPIILALFFFLYSTSFIPHVFGKAPGALYLNNAGRYYDNYLIKTTEVSAVDWLDAITNGNSDITNGIKLQVQTGRYSQKKFASLTPLDAYNEIFPGVVRKDAYVFLGQATTQKQRATLVYGGDQITYAYPIQFLDDNKNLIYNNGSAKIYR